MSAKRQNVLQPTIIIRDTKNKRDAMKDLYSVNTDKFNKYTTYLYNFEILSIYQHFTCLAFSSSWRGFIQKSIPNSFLIQGYTSGHSLQVYMYLSFLSSLLNSLHTLKTKILVQKGSKLSLAAISQSPPHPGISELPLIMLILPHK